MSLYIALIGSRSFSAARSLDCLRFFKDLHDVTLSMETLCSALQINVDHLSCSRKKYTEICLKLWNFFSCHDPWHALSMDLSLILELLGKNSRVYSIKGEDICNLDRACQSRLISVNKKRFLKLVILRSLPSKKMKFINFFLVEW